jgi:gamma-glutamyltranspeptidase/glutathione hydrolase
VNNIRNIRQLLVTTVAALTSLGIATMSIAADRLTDKAFTTRSEVIAPHGMAATSQPLATQIALDILKAGGSAADAAIAANAALGLMEPVGSGIGGDLFAIVWDADKKELAGLNASGRSPKSLTLEHLKSLGLEKIPALGPLPVSVPGAVDGWFELHQRYGKLPMSEVLAPAIRYAREGFPLSEVIAFYWGRNAQNLKDYAGFAEVYMPGGKAPVKGEMFRNPRLADTYERLGKEGRDVFYSGDMARAIADYMAENEGFLSYEDMASHTSEWIDPVSTNYRGYDVWELPPNGQGIAALQILNVLEGYDIAAMGFGSPEYVHAFVEAKKLAFEDRARFYADMDFYDVPVAKLISKEYAEERRKLIDPDRAARSYPAGDAAIEHGDTIYLTTADADGNMVSLIQSNFRGMGSGMTPGGLGFDRGPSERLRAGQTPVPHHHPRVRHQGRQAAHELRRHGRRHAAPGPRPDHRQHDRLRHEPAGGRRRAADPPHRLQPAHRPGHEGRGHRLSRTRLFPGDGQRPEAKTPPDRRGHGRLRRLPGDHARPRAGRVLRRVRIPQGRARSRLLGPGRAPRAAAGRISGYTQAHSRRAVTRRVTPIRGWVNEEADCGQPAGCRRHVHLWCGLLEQSRPASGRQGYR